MPRSRAAPEPGAVTTAPPKQGVRGGRIADVVFDLGGVLVDWDPRHLFCRHLGRDPAAVERFLSEVCTSRWHAGLDGGRGFEEAAAHLIGRFPEHEDWILDYVRGWRYMFAGNFPGTVELLHTLQRSGVRVHALSNYPAEQIAFLYETYPFMRAFETVVLSGLIGVQKPDPAIFDYLLERIDHRPCLFADDRPENLAAARVRGIETVELSRDAVAARRELRTRCAGD